MTLTDFEDVDEAIDDTESDDEGFLDALLNPIGAIAGALGAPSPSGLIGGLLGGGPARPPISSVRPPMTSGGVNSATVNTPRGSATIALPETVVSKDDFNNAMQRLTTSINSNSSRINTTQTDVRNLTSKVGTIAESTRRDVVRLRQENARTRKADQAALAKLRRDTSSQSMMGMLMAMMAQQQTQSTFSAHVHGIPAGATTTSAPTNASSSGNSMSMLLPMMMMSGDSGDSGGSNDMMMMMMLMMAMGPKQ